MIFTYHNNKILLQTYYHNCTSSEINIAILFQSNSVSSTRTNRLAMCVRLKFPVLFRDSDQQHGGKHASTYSRNIHEQMQQQWKSVNAAALKCLKCYS